MGETKPVAELLAGDGSPRWDVVTFTVECPRCGYNLRSLVRPGCPECGLEFAWPQVLDDALHHNPFLFEHNWHKRPVRSLLKTLWLSLRPQSFWSRVSIHEKVNARVLWLFVLASPVVFWVTVNAVGCGLWNGLQLTEWLWNPHGWNPYSVTSSISVTINAHGGYSYSYSSSPTTPPVHQALTELLIAYIIELGPGPWMLLWWGLRVHLLLSAAIIVLTAMGVVRMLWQSLGRYRIRGVQVLRVVAYASVPAAIVMAFFYLSFLLLIVYIEEISEWSAKPSWHWGPMLIRIFLMLCAATLPLGFYLAAGLKFYLKLPHARFVGMVSVFIGALLMSVVLVLCGIRW